MLTRTATTLASLALAACRPAPVADHAVTTQEPTYERFVEEVLPLMEERCGAGCHGLSEEALAAARALAPEGLYFPLDQATGRVPRDAATLREVYDTVRGGDHDEHGGGPPRIDRGADPELSVLLRKPLADAFGGLSHAGIDVFETPDDEGYRLLLGWVREEIAAHPEPAPSSTEAERFFADHVVGVLERNGCFLGGCHGPDVFNDLKLEPGLPALQPGATTRSAAMLATLRGAVLGATSRFVNLGGALERSRLLVKNLPLAVGGVHQRGGNQQFFEGYDDPDVQTLLAWMALERAELASQLRAGERAVAEDELGLLRGVAFLRGPRHAPRRFFDPDGFWPGTRLMLLEEGAREARPLVDVAGMEIQAFDLRYDARALIFSARRSADQGFKLYELELDADLGAAGPPVLLSSGPERLPDGSLVHHLDPVYIPGPDDPEGHDLAEVAVAFASNAAGAWASSSVRALVGEADGGTPSLLIDRQRTERAGSLAGRRLDVLVGPLAGAWRRIVRHEEGGRLHLDAPLSEAPDSRTVYAIEELEADHRSSFDVWRVVPGQWAETARRMTFTAAQERRPTVRTTGEVMFTSVRNRAWQGDKPVYNGAIYRVMAGGFDYHIHGNNRSRYTLVSDSRELPSGLEIRLAQDPRNLWGGGSLLLVDHGFGVHIEPDNPVDHIAWASGEARPVAASQRYLPAQLPLLPESGDEAVVHTGVSPGGAFRDPWPHSDGTIFVARAERAIDHLDPDADPDWDLYRLRFVGALQSEDGQRAGPVELERIEGASSSEADYHPRPVAVRLKEKPETHQKFAESLEEAPEPDAGVLRMPAATPAELECYDYPLLQSFLTSFAPVGSRDLREEELSWVRIVRQEPPGAEDLSPVGEAGGDPFATPLSLGIHTAQAVVAEVPIEADGSFYAEVPPETPLVLQGLDAERMALQGMSRWFYLHPGEKLTFSIPRSIFPTRCAGCHGALTGDKRDALGPPDVVSGASRVAATWNPPEGERREPHRQEEIRVDFDEHVQPILDRRCTRCHGEEAPGGLDLRGSPAEPWSVSYRALHRLADPEGSPHRKRYLNEREGLAAESPLLEKLLGRELRAPGSPDTPGVPHPADAPLEDEELLTLVRWLDLGATWRGAR